MISLLFYVDFLERTCFMFFSLDIVTKCLFINLEASGKKSIFNNEQKTRATFTDKKVLNF